MYFLLEDITVIVDRRKKICNFRYKCHITPSISNFCQNILDEKSLQSTFLVQ